MQHIELSSLNIIDYVVLSIITLSALFGFFRGFVASALSFIGWVASIILTYLFFPDIETLLLKVLSSKVVIVALGYSILLLLFLLAFGILNIIIYNFIGSFKKSFLDRSIGIVFGLLRGFLIISFLFLCFTMSVQMLSGSSAHDKGENENLPKWLTNAQTFNAMKFGSDTLEGFMPKSLKEKFQSIYDDVSDRKADDRFIENSIEKLSDYATDDEIRSINLKRHELSITESEETVDIHTLKILLDLYQEKIKNGQIKKPEISTKEIHRLESIIKHKLKNK